MTLEFDFKPERVWEETYITEGVLVTRYESRKEQRREKFPPRHIFTLEFRKTEEQGEEIWEFYKDEAKGTLNSFSWEHPVTEETFTVRFAENLSREHFVGNLDKAQTFSITLIELRAGDQL